jgi:hypothetical protein
LSQNRRFKCNLVKTTGFFLQFRNYRRLVMPVYATSTPTSFLTVSNAFINARFTVSTAEMRMLLAMIAAIKRDDNFFQEVRVPIQELVAPSGRRLSKKDYQRVEAMCDALAKRHIKMHPKQGRGSAALDFDYFPILAYVRCRAERGVIQVRFNKKMHTYLSQLTQNFTVVQGAQLYKLKSPYSVRIYLLLKQYADFGKRTIAVEELKAMLKLDGKYKQLALFRLRVLDHARQELSKTDLAFDYQLLPGRERRVEFTFKLQSVSQNSRSPISTGPEPKLTAWEQALQAIGLSPPNYATLVEQVRQGRVKVEYVQFVLKKQRAGHTAGKIRSLAGAVYAAITKGQLLAEFNACQVQRPPAQSRVELQKVQGALEEARISLAFVEQNCQGEERQRFEAQVKADIANYEAILKAA